jgi:hypothetical protein
LLSKADSWPATGGVAFAAALDRRTRSRPPYGAHVNSARVSKNGLAPIETLTYGKGGQWYV